MLAVHHRGADVQIFLTNRVLELVWCEVILCRSSVEDDVDDNASRCSQVQIPDHSAVCDSVCYNSNQLLDKNTHSEDIWHRRCHNANYAFSGSYSKKSVYNSIGLTCSYEHSLSRCYHVII